MRKAYKQRMAIRLCRRLGFDPYEVASIRLLPDCAVIETYITVDGKKQYDRRRNAAARRFAVRPLAD